MPTPFPGMDPYLERPNLWPNVHNSLLIALRDELAPRLCPRYYVAVEERIVRLVPDEMTFALRPDVAVIQPQPLVTSAGGAATGQPSVVTVEVPLPDEVREVYLEIRDVGADRVVTVVELLSPSNKLPGEGRSQYEQKQLNVLGTRTHLVEIDLLRRAANANARHAAPERLPHPGQPGRAAADGRPAAVHRAPANPGLPITAARGRPGTCG